MHSTHEFTHASLNPVIQSDLWGTSSLFRTQPLFDCMGQRFHDSSSSQHFTICLFLLSMHEVCCTESAIIPTRQDLMRLYHLLPNPPVLNPGRSA